MSGQNGQGCVFMTCLPPLPSGLATPHHVLVICGVLLPLLLGRCPCPIDGGEESFEHGISPRVRMPLGAQLTIDDSLRRDNATGGVSPLRNWGMRVLLAWLLLICRLYMLWLSGSDVHASLHSVAPLERVPLMDKLLAQYACTQRSNG